MSRPWMPLYVADYLGDTRRLTTLEHGAYMLLIMEYWQHGGLPDDDRELADIVGLDAEQWAAMRPRISRLFKPGWKHKRIDEELAKAAEISERRRASAEQRWSKSNANAEQKDATCNARARVPQPQSQDNNNPSSSTTQKEGEEFFEKFWSSFPKGKLASRPRASEAFFDLPPHDWPKALAAVAPFAEQARASPTSHPMSPERYLRDRIFENFSPSLEASSGVYVQSGSPQWVAWDLHWRTTKGRGPPLDSKGGWRFEAEWPPSESAA